MNDNEPTEIIRDTAWLCKDEKATPMWLRTLYASLPISAVCIVHGGIHDLHTIVRGGRLSPSSTIAAIWRVLEDSGFHALLTFDPLNGLDARYTTGEWDREKIARILEDKTKIRLVQNLLMTPAERAEQAADDPAIAEVSFMGMDAVAEAIATSKDPAMALVINYTSQMRDENQSEDQGFRKLMLASLMLSNSYLRIKGNGLRFPRQGQEGHVRRPIIWLVDRIDDLPAWLTYGDGIRSISIGMPDLDARTRIAKLLTYDAQSSQGQPDDIVANFANATEGLTTRGMLEVSQLVRNSEFLVNIEDAVRTYRHGFSDSPWQGARLQEKLKHGKAELKNRVKGQDKAVEHVLSILSRSALGLTDSHKKKISMAPRGVLYFAGPTGVGKTEMAKAVAELVFGDADAIIRFDMSEFQDKHAKIRLVGAPPSYVGFGSGGELTNAVQQRPHSIVLFDEMDKANKAVYDLFLQILDDGRLTDGSGRTTLFNETIIIFTSNQGAAGLSDSVKALDLSVRDDVERYESIFRKSVSNFFKKELDPPRPEFMGRLGDNIVAFHPIWGDVAHELAVTFIENILANVQIHVGNSVSISDNARKNLLEVVTAESVLEKGGRGIAKALETNLVNPLARELFNEDREKSLTIVQIGTDEDGQPAVEVS